MRQFVDGKCKKLVVFFYFLERGIFHERKSPEQKSVAINHHVKPVKA